MSAVPRAWHFGFTRGGRLRGATDHYRAGAKRVDTHDCGRAAKLILGEEAWPSPHFKATAKLGEFLTQLPA